MASPQKRRVFVIGVGMTKFEKPGARKWDYPDMGAEAAVKALADAGIKYTDIESACVGYVYGDTTCGQRALYQVGMTGVPIYNVNNACATGSTALYLARNLISGGLANCVLALGFDKMSKGALSYMYNDRTSPLDQHMAVVQRTRGIENAPFAPQMFGAAGREHMDKYGTKKEHFAKIAYKNHKHSKHNPYAQFRDEYTMEQILKSPNVYEPLTKLQCCPTSEGGACSILASEEFVRQHGLEHQAVEIIGMSLKTDTRSTFDDNSNIKMVGFDMTANAANDAFQQTGLSPKDVQVIELHDCFSANELVTYEALGLCPTGKAGELVDRGDVTYGGKWVVNPSGGLISKGHPLGATGLAQCSELTWQLRQMAGARQVPNCKVALQHNVGLGGAVVVTLYRLGFPDKFKPFPAGKPNPALEDVRPAELPAMTEPVQAPQPSVPAASGNAGPHHTTPGMIFTQLGSKLATDPELVNRIKATYRFNIKTAKGDVQHWTVNMKQAPAKIAEAGSDPADCTISMEEQDFIHLMTGKLDAQKAFMQGKLKVGGNMQLALKLGDIIKPKSKL